MAFSAVEEATHQSIVQQFAGAVGPAFDDFDLERVLSSGEHLLFASAGSDGGAAAAAVEAITKTGIKLQSEVRGMAALVRAPAVGLLECVRSVTEVLALTCASDVHLVVGGVAGAESESRTNVAVSIWMATGKEAAL